MSSGSSHHHCSKHKKCQKNQNMKPCVKPEDENTVCNELPFLLGRATVTIPNNTAIKDIPYNVSGTLACSFEQNRGIFIAKEPGFYQFFYYVTYQALQTSGNNGNITVQVDGERRMRLIRNFASTCGNTNEQSFIGQYQYVPGSMLAPLRTGQLTEQFTTMMSTAATLSLNCGDTVQLSVYQNNLGIQNPPPNVTLPSGPISITAFIEFTIIKIAESSAVPSAAVQSFNGPCQLGFQNMPITNVLLQQNPIQVSSSVFPIGLSVANSTF